jgi:hypothetical protein
MTVRDATIYKKLNVFFPDGVNPSDTTKKILKIFGWVKEAEATEGDNRNFNVYKTYGAFIEATMLNAIIEKGGKMPTFTANIGYNGCYTLQAMF